MAAKMSAGAVAAASCSFGRKRAPSAPLPCSSPAQEPPPCGGWPPKRPPAGGRPFPNRTRYAGLRFDFFGAFGLAAAAGLAALRRPHGQAHIPRAMPSSGGPASPGNPKAGPAGPHLAVVEKRGVQRGGKSVRKGVPPLWRAFAFFSHKVLRSPWRLCRLRDAASPLRGKVGRPRRPKFLPPPAPQGRNSPCDASRRWRAHPRSDASGGKLPLRRRGPPPAK